MHFLGLALWGYASLAGNIISHTRTHQVLAGSGEEQRRGRPSEF